MSQSGFGTAQEEDNSEDDRETLYMGLMMRYTSLRLSLSQLFNGAGSLPSFTGRPPQRCPLTHTHTHTHILIAQFTCIILVMQWWVNCHPTLCTEAETEMDGGVLLVEVRWRRGKEQSEKENEEGRFERFSLKRRWHGELSWMMDEASLQKTSGSFSDVLFSSPRELWFFSNADITTFLKEAFHTTPEDGLLVKNNSNNKNLSLKEIDSGHQAMGFCSFSVFVSQLSYIWGFKPVERRDFPHGNGFHSRMATRWHR